MSDKDPDRDDIARDTAAHNAPAGTPSEKPGKAEASDVPSPQDPGGESGTGEASEPVGEASTVTPVESAEKTPSAEPAGEGGETGGTEKPGGSADGSDGTPGDQPATGEDGSSPDAASGAEGPPPGGASGGDGGKPRKRRTRRQKVLRRTALGAALLLLVGTAGAAGLYYDLMGGIAKKDATGQLGSNRPKKLNKSLNILLIGSDTRDGANARYGAAAGMSGARSDTAILLHLSPNRDQAVGISFPRDSMVDIPKCKKEKGGTVPAQFGMLNAAFAYAGPTCTWKTLESLTGIHIDHFVQVDFTGFKRMVDALGGVEICVDRPVNDPRAELSLKAGKQTVKGDDALGYVRARYSLGNGSDLERIERQQKFMASVVGKATSGEVLTDPAKSYKFLKAATKSITTDDDLDLSTMKKLVDGLKGMSAGQVRFVTVPTKGYAPDPNRVQWNQELAKPLFEAVQHDNDLPAEPAVPAAAQQHKPLEPKKVKVTVVDAGAADKQVKGIVRQLRHRGFDVAKRVENGPATAESRIVHAPASEAQASVLAQILPNAMLSPDGNAPKDGVRLVIGRNGVRVTPPAINKIAGGVKGGQNLCK